MSGLGTGVTIYPSDARFPRLHMGRLRNAQFGLWTTSPACAKFADLARGALEPGSRVPGPSAAKMHSPEFAVEIRLARIASTEQIGNGLFYAALTFDVTLGAGARRDFVAKRRGKRTAPKCLHSIFPCGARPHWHVDFKPKHRSLPSPAAHPDRQRYGRSQTACDRPTFFLVSPSSRVLCFQSPC